MVKRSQAFHFALFTVVVSVFTGMNIPAWAGETPFSHKDLYLILQMAGYLRKSPAISKKRLSYGSSLTRLPVQASWSFATKAGGTIMTVSVLPA